MKFNIKKFKNNILFFIVSIALIIVLLLVSVLFGKKGVKIDKTDLTNDEVDIKKLVINEIMASNNGVISDEEGTLYDYIEIYNGSDSDISLKNYGLSDENDKVKWAFGDITIESKKYIVVKLTGKKGELSADFKLKSSGGEVVTLFKPNGKVIDAVETVSLDSNYVMARDPKGNWVVQDEPTPGFANTIDGHKEFIASLVSSEDETIVINEVLPDNKGNFKNKNGEYSGYIEVKNVSDKSINIANYSLSNSEDVSFKWQFPSIKLSPGEVTVVYTSGISRKSGELSTGFKLKNKNGVAVLTNNKGKVIDKVEYKNLANGKAYIRNNNTMSEGSSISPGYDNGIDGIKDFQKKYMSTPDGLIINEVMNNNYKYLPQNGGNYYDWIELYNNSNDTIKLSDYCLTNTTNNICMYKLPNAELGKGEYYLVMASGTESLSNNKYKHANFKIGDVEGIYLTKNRNIVDSILVSDVPNGSSIGKGKDYGVYYYKTPTPGNKNGNGDIAMSSMPTSSVSGGVFNNKDEIEVTLTGSGKIYYTLDGSTPTVSSKIYSSPLTIKETTVLRIMNKEDGKLESETKTYSYIMNENHKIAVMSLSIDNKKLNNVNSHTSLNSSVIEQTNVEFYDTDGNSFEVGAGLKLFGGSTRSYKKKSYEIKFKKEFGDAHLKYKVFDTVDSSMYESLVLRTGSQDEFEYDNQRTVIKDVVATSLMDEYTDVDVQAYKPIALYINGKYWGIYFIREKVDETFISNHYNVQATKENSSILRIDGEVKFGTNKDYNSLINFVSNNSMSDKSNYDKVKDQIDITSLCDFWIGEIYTANYDILNTRYFSSSEVDNGKWKYIFYDIDSGFFRTNQNTFTEYTNPNGMGAWNFPTTLLRNLMKSDEFKKTFLERLSYNLKNTWSYDNVNKRIDEVIEEIGKDEFKRNAERWNNSFSHWEKSITAMKTFAKKRNAILVKYAKSYFNLSDSEVKKYFGDVK